jgi:hypothetical protein
MSGNAAQLDAYWDQPSLTEAPSPYMQANSSLRSISETSVGWKPVQPITLDVLGVEICWTPDGREFPEPVLETIANLYKIYGLDAGWDSYGAKPLDRNLVSPALKLIFAAHNRGCATRVVPLPTGGLGLRLETTNVEIELDLHPENALEITVEKLETGEIEELEACNAEAAQELIEAHI